MKGGKIIIAIDGYSSTGKSTFAKLIALKLGYLYIDTGALYRAITLYAIRENIITNDCTIDLNKLNNSFLNLKVSFHNNALGKSETYLFDENVEKLIRSLSVSNKVSHIAAIPQVRQFVNKILIEIGSHKGVVMDGRDIGTAVFPNAEIKIFMTANQEVRVQRRLEELTKKGESPKYEDVVKNIKERDYIDQHRAADPLMRAGDAILLDNSNMTIEQQLKWFDKILDENNY